MLYRYKFDPTFNYNNVMENHIDNTPRKYNKNTVLGFVLLLIGLGVLVKQSAFILFPHWVFSWPFILIIIGLAIGAKNNFQKSNWIFITGIGRSKSRVINSIGIIRQNCTISIESVIGILVYSMSKCCLEKL